MKKRLLFIVVSLFTAQYIFSQSAQSGKAVAELFTDFHYMINDTVRTTGFGINRAYIGYNYTPEGPFSGSMILNIGSPEELAAGAKHRRYPFFREASLSYTKDKLKMSFGITTARATIFQQNFMGKRYIADNFQSKNAYCYVADMGFVLDYTINNRVKVDFTVMNGEGYSELQLDNSVKTSAGINIVPFTNSVIRLYYDIDHPNNIWQSLSMIFLGYKNQNINFGAEAAYKTNLDKTNGHDAWGYSATCAVKVANRTELFGRYDHSTSTVLNGEVIGWNLKNDGDLGIFGIQYTFNQYAQFALDYQGIFPDNPLLRNSNGIFLNAHFKF
ncbi:MAG TPA: hypothetical protein VHO68_02160 [Bacteroidales bacterium]|nr:hypothetical protein [Bacteroidales bacterium]